MDAAVVQQRLYDGTTHVEGLPIRATAAAATAAVTQAVHVVVDHRLTRQPRILKRPSRLFRQVGRVPVYITPIQRRSTTTTTTTTTHDVIIRISIIMITVYAVYTVDVVIVTDPAHTHAGVEPEPEPDPGPGVGRTDGEGEAHGRRLRLTVTLEEVRELFVNVPREKLTQGVQRPRLLELHDARVRDDDKAATWRHVLRGELASKRPRGERQFFRRAEGIGRIKIPLHAGRRRYFSHRSHAGRCASDELLRRHHLA